MQAIKIGDRVGWFADTSITGTIKQIYLTTHPFYVLWDKGTDDWYKGENLVLLRESPDTQDINNYENITTLD